MAEEEVAVAASSAPSVHKRKLEDMEAQEETQQALTAADANDKTNSVKTAEEEEEEEEEEREAEEAITGDDSGASEVKRLRSEPQPDGLVIENGHQVCKLDDAVDVDEQPTVENNVSSEDTQQVANESLEVVKGEQPSGDNYQTDDIQQHTVENPQLETSEQEPSGGTLQEPSSEANQQGDVFLSEEQPVSGNQNMSRQMEVPNNKVGVLIGKGGETIRFLQYNSGAKIQITRDADADQSSMTRPVELIGSLESINKAEKLINDVIAEADAGGSPSLVARGFSTVQAAGSAEQLQIQVPNEKVGLIIGKGGETIKNLQTKSGARIQLIPQHLPEGDQSKERTVRVTGERKQIEIASEMIKDVMNQPVRSSSLSSGYNQQAFRPRGPPAPSHWGPRGPYPAQPTGYEHQQRGPYSSQNPQYPHATYGNYPPQQMAPRGSFAPGWDLRPAATLQGPPSQGGGYEYYGGQGGRIADAPSSAPQSNPIHNHASGPSVPVQANYNYGQPQGPNYGQPTPYSQSAPPSQGFGHGYGEAKYDNQAPTQHPYGGHGVAQQVAYPQGGSHPGYGPQDQYGKPPSYGMAPQGQPSQSYGQPRANLPGDSSYQGSISATQPYGPNASSQQPYPYASSGQMQQTYASYGSQPASDGYNQPHVASSVPSYAQQGSQAVSGYGQAGGQQAPGYAQVVPTGGHGAYPSSQTSYNEQSTLNNASYAYQGATDPAYGGGPAPGYGAQPTAQPGYTQQPPTQQGYDQSIQQSGGYGSIPGSVPVGYGKSLSPQPGYPQYDSTQMYGPHG